MISLATRLKRIIRSEGYISSMNLVEQNEYTSEQVLFEAIRLNHSDLVDMLLDEYPELKNTPRILDKIFYLTNPKLTNIVLSYLPQHLKNRYAKGI